MSKWTHSAPNERGHCNRFASHKIDAIWLIIADNDHNSSSTPNSTRFDSLPFICGFYHICWRSWFYVYTFISAEKKHYKNPSLVSLIRIGRFLYANLIVSFGPGCLSFHSHVLRLLCCKPNDNISTIVHEYLCSYPFDSNRAWNTVSLCPALYTILNSFCHSFGVLFRCYLSFILLLCHAFSFYTQWTLHILILNTIISSPRTIYQHNNKKNISDIQTATFRF